MKKIFTFLLSDRKRMNFPHSVFWRPSSGSGSSEKVGRSLFWYALIGINEIIDQIDGLKKESIVAILWSIYIKTWKEQTHNASMKLKKNNKVDGASAEHIDNSVTVKRSKGHPSTVKWCAIVCYINMNHSICFTESLVQVYKVLNNITNWSEKISTYTSMGRSQTLVRHMFLQSFCSNT